MSSKIRFVGAIVLLLTALAFLHLRDADEFVPSREEFSTFPYRLGSWVGRDVNIAPDVLHVLGSGDFLARDYADSTSANGNVGVFVAYIPSQRAADTLHSPKHCLPGAGWIPVTSKRVTIALPGSAPFIANRYIVAKGAERVLVLYWYLAHGRAVASEYWAKFYLVQDSIRLNRSDGSLIRLTTELDSNETAADGERRLLSLLGVALPVIESYVPR